MEYVPDLGPLTCAAPWADHGQAKDEWEARVRQAVLKYVDSPRPAFTRLPFDYQRVPIRLRLLALRLTSRRAAGGRAFPSWPIETSLDSPLTSSRSANGYGEGKAAALVLTHDVDSAAELALIPDLVDADQDYGLKSSVGFVPNRSWPPDSLARRILGAGCEIYLHDISHDGLLPYMRPGSIHTAIGEALASTEWARNIRTFRSGQLLMSRDLLRAISNRFDVDLSIPDTERGGPYGATAGCGTVLPFRFGRMLELPLSLPQDAFLLQVERLTPAEILRLWLAKLDHVLQAGGVATLNTHPIWVNSRRPAMWATYIRFLEHVTQRPGLLVTTPSALADRLPYAKAG